MKKRRKARQQANIGPYILMGVGALLLLTVALLLFARSNPPGSQTAEPGTTAQVTVERISLEESKAAFDNQEALFLDVRDPSSYEASHIPGAVNIPLALLDARANTLDPNQWIITYCT